MIRLGITQRVLTRPDRGESWDCLDQRLIALVASLGYLPIPLGNSMSDPRRYAQDLGLDGVVLSGGNDLASLPDGRDVSAARDTFETGLLNHCERARLPVLGICRGLQMLNIFWGGVLAEDSYHVSTRHDVLACTEAPPAWPRRFEVNSFHRWTISKEGLAQDLAALVQAQDGTIEAARHKTLPMVGVMWHPERETALPDHDRKLFQSLFGGPVP